MADGNTEKDTTLKFWVRVMFSLIVMGFGIAIFFTQDDKAMKLNGAILVSSVLGAWTASAGSPTKKITGALPQTPQSQQLTEAIGGQSFTPPPNIAAYDLGAADAAAEEAAT